VEGIGQKLFMDNYCSSSKLLSDLYSRKINNRDTVRHNRKGMPANFGPKLLKLLCEAKRGTSAVCKKDKWEIRVYLPINMQQRPTSGHYVEDEGNASKHYILKVTTATWILST
jgi:hypothetical protein